MNRKIAAAIAAAVLMLAGCGSSEKEDKSTSLTVGGAVTKTSEESTAETQPQEETGEESEAEEEAELAQSYEGSFTQIFADKLNDMDFGIDIDVFDTDGDEGMDKVQTISISGNGDMVNCMKSTLSPDGTVETEDTIMLYEGKIYEMNDGEDKFRYMYDYDDASASMFTEMVMGRPWDMEFVSADSYSDGTVAELFNSPEGTYTYTYDSLGTLMSVDTAGTLINVSIYDESADIELTEGFSDMLP